LAARADQQLSVPISVINVPVGYVAHVADKEAIVAISPQSGQAQVKPDEIKAVVDLSKTVAPVAADTVVTVPVTPVAPNVVLQSLSPASVTVTIEKIEQKNVPLAVHYSEQQQSTVVVRGQVTLTPSSAMVRGAADALAQVAGVRVDVPLPADASPLDEMIRPVPVDSLGRDVSGLQVSPDLVRVEAHFTSGTGAKD
jgi:YbbR domain-containing protein